MGIPVATGLAFVLNLTGISWFKRKN
jgi:hypothetical protein